MDNPTTYADFRTELQTIFAACGCTEMPPQPLIHPVLRTNFTMSMALTLRPAREFAEKEILGQRRSVIQPCIRIHDADRMRSDAVPWHLSFFEMAGAFSNGRAPRKTCLEMLFSIIEDLMRIHPGDCLFEPYAGGDEAMPGRDDQTISVLRGLGIPEARIRPARSSFFGRRRDESMMGPMVEISADLDGTGWREIATIVFLDLAIDAEGTVRTNDIPFAEFGFGMERAMCARLGTADIRRCAPLQSSMAFFAGVRPELQLLAADRLRAAVFAISEGVRPARGGRRSILRNLLRDVFAIDDGDAFCNAIVQAVGHIVATYAPYHDGLLPPDEILPVIWNEFEHQRKLREADDKA